MFPVMTRASRWNGYLFCLLLVAMMIYGVPQLLRYAGSQDQALTLYLDGELARDFEGEFDQQLPLRDLAIRFWGNLRYLVFREGENGVVLGQQHWLYTTEELVYPSRLDTVLAGHLSRIGEFREALARRQQQLILVPVPMKVATYPQYLGRTLPAPVARLYPRLIETLNQRQWPHVDLATAFHQPVGDDEPLFLARDTHWSPRGARLAADTIARTWPELQGDRSFRTERLDDSRYQGDLTGFILTSDGLAEGYKASEVVPRFETHGDLTMPTTAALFGDHSDRGVDLVGTSYSQIERWHFTGFLQQALAREVSTFAVEALGPYAAMERYLADTHRDAQPDTVIWEFPVRALLQPLDPNKSWQQSLDEQF